MDVSPTDLQRAFKHHSQRDATKGLQRVARRAGRQQAARVTALRKSAILAKVAGSKSSLVRPRVPAKSIPTPRSDKGMPSRNTGR